MLQKNTSRLQRAVCKRIIYYEVNFIPKVHPNKFNKKERENKDASISRNLLMWYLQVER